MKASKRSVLAVIALVIAVLLGAYSAAGYMMAGSLTQSSKAATVYLLLAAASACVLVGALVILYRFRRSHSAGAT